MIPDHRHQSVQEREGCGPCRRLARRSARYRLGRTIHARPSVPYRWPRAREDDRRRATALLWARWASR